MYVLKFFIEPLSINDVNNDNSRRSKKHMIESIAKQKNNKTIINNFQT